MPADVNRELSVPLVSQGAPFVRVEHTATSSKPEAASIRRDVYVYINVFSVSEITTATETFDAHFYIRACWVEPGLQPGQRIEESTWKPCIMFMNPASNPEIEDENFEVMSSRKGPDGSTVLKWAAKVRGTFREQFELRAFPFDVQPLSIWVSTQHMNVRLHEDTFDGTKSLMREEFMSLPEFLLSGPFFLPKAELALDKYPILGIQFVAKRKFPYHLFNIYFPLFLLSGMLFSSFAVGPTEPGDRIPLTLTVVLASVAYKYIVSQDLPRISYLTLCDTYVLANFPFSALVVFQNAYVSMAASSDPDGTEERDSQWYYGLLALFLGGHVFYILVGLYFFYDERKKLYERRHLA